MVNSYASKVEFTHSSCNAPLAMEDSREGVVAGDFSKRVRMFVECKQRQCAIEGRQGIPNPCS